jgi:hypothetical protein
LYQWRGIPNFTFFRKPKIVSSLELQLSKNACEPALWTAIGLVLYRASGRAFLDNIRQVPRIVILFSIAIFARSLGFYGVLAGRLGSLKRYV